MRLNLAALVILASAVHAVRAGHTRPGYVDGCRSADGRFSVVAKTDNNPKGRDNWSFVWKDAKTGETYTGKLVGIPYGVDHFRVAYSHIFVPPGGETFAVWQPGSFAPAAGKPPAGDVKSLDKPTAELKNYAGFDDRLVIYKKTGEVVRRLHLRDILRDDEWKYTFRVQGNLYFLREYGDVVKGGEPPRAGYRYYRVSPDYSVLEFVVGPNADAVHRVKEYGRAAVEYRRVVRLSLADGKEIDAGERLPKERTPVRPFVGELVKRGSDGQRKYVPSLDPVREAGKIGE